MARKPTESTRLAFNAQCRLDAQRAVWRDLISDGRISIDAVRRILDAGDVKLSHIGDEERPLRYPPMHARLFLEIPTITGQCPRYLYLQDDDKTLVLVEWEYGKNGPERVSRTVDVNDRWVLGILRSIIRSA